MWATHSNNIVEQDSFDKDNLACLAVADDSKKEWNSRNCTQRLPFICVLEQIRPKQGHTKTNFLSPGAFAELTHKVLDHDRKHYIEIELEFSTKERNGMLLWQGERSEAFICIGIVNGRLFVDIAEKRPFQRSIEVADGEVHTVNLVKYSDKYELAIDREAIENVTLDEEFTFDHARPVYLGGLPVSEGKIWNKTDGLFQKGFVGCIHHAGFYTHCKPDIDNCNPYSANPVDFSDHSIVTKLYNSKVDEHCVATGLVDTFEPTLAPETHSEGTTSSKPTLVTEKQVTQRSSLSQKTSPAIEVTTGRLTLQPNDESTPTYGLSASGDDFVN